jgi:DNA-binding NarL/FixJ family response regulator
VLAGFNSRVIRVLVVDDHPIVRRRLCALLTAEPELEVVGEAASGREAMLKAAELRPNVVVLDVSLPDMDGLEVARQIGKIVPVPEVLVVSEHGEAMMEAAFRAGARGYLFKSDSSRELATAVRTVNGSSSNTLVRGLPTEMSYEESYEYVSGIGFEQCLNFGYQTCGFSFGHYCTDTSR